MGAARWRVALLRQRVPAIGSGLLVLPSVVLACGPPGDAGCGRRGTSGASPRSPPSPVPRRLTIELDEIRLRLLPAVAVAVGLMACADPPGPRGVAVRDSAGITVIDHGTVDLDTLPRWELSDSPRLSIGSVDGEEAYQLHGVTDVRRRRDGSIVMVDRTRRVRAFDSAGAHLWTAGREGRGPGEFRFPSMVGEARGDSVVVWDGGTSRLSVFTPGGDFARSATPRGMPAGMTVAWGLTAREHLLVEVRHGERTRIDGREALLHPSDFYLVDLDGEVSRELGRRVFAINYREVDENGAFSPAIFATSAVIGAVAGGLWYGDAEEYELRHEDGPGRVRRIVRWQGPDRTVTDRDVAAVLEEWGGGPDGDPELRRFIAEYGRTHPRAEKFAAYEDLIVDRRGRLWVRDFVKDHEDDGRRTWTVFSADGAEILGRLTHGARIEPYDIGDGWLLAVERDDLDVERVRLYAILRGRRSPPR